MRVPVHHRVCVAILSAALFLALAGREAAAEPTRIGPAAPGVFADDVRTLPIAPPSGEWREGPRRRRTHPDSVLVVPVPQHQRDPLLALQAPLLRRSARVYTPPELNFEGATDPFVAPPDTIGDVGSNYYIQAVNGGVGTHITIHNKTNGAVVSGPFILSNLWSSGGPCSFGSGDPIVLYDPLASRWLLSEFAASGNHLCVYVSRNNDPLTGGWLNYDFETPEFPDYPKFGVWPDAYYVTTNESSPAVYALDRTNMLAGLAATAQRFTAPSLSGLSFQALTPADLDGASPPPLGSRAFFVRQVDDEVNPPAVAGSDRVEVWQLHVDFATPANSTFGLATAVSVTEFSSDLCGTTSFDCIPQPGTSQLLDPLREVVLWRAQYRNFGAYQTLIGNFATDVDGSDHAGIRWFELRRIGVGAWSLFQEGTYAPDSDHRWLGSIAMDGSGNMALGFSISSDTTFPGIRYTGRLATSASGVMDQPEVNVMSGSGSQSFDRWGDYSSMNVDPIDDCSFWYTNEYIPASGDWQTRIARFRYDAPTCINAAAPTCGNNVKEVGEDCDGLDASSCSGLCTPSCTCPAPSCGNNVVEVGERCDGTSAGTCSNGCNPDCTCKLCGTTPAAGCFQAAVRRSSVLILDQADNTRDKISWSWKKGAATTKNDFGNPLAAGSTPSYAVCVYDGSANSQPLMLASIAAGGVCGASAKPCWRETRTGFNYSNRDSNSTGMTKARLRSGIAGRSQVQLQGKGMSLATPNPALTLPVTVQLLIDNGTSIECWQTAYTSSTRNDDKTFRAKGP